MNQMDTLDVLNSGAEIIAKTEEIVVVDFQVDTMKIIEKDTEIIAKPEELVEVDNKETVEDTTIEN
jgi:hypothetical protein